MADGVGTKKKQYEHKEYEYRQLRDTAAGMSSVKRSGSLYLPIPNAMIVASNQPPAGLQASNGNNSSDNTTEILENAPWAHSIAPYSAYLQRARFPDIVATFLRGLVGIGTKTDPVIELPSQMMYLIDNATSNGLGLIKFFERALAENLLMGRYEWVVEPFQSTDGPSQFNFVSYSAESFINWKTSTFNGVEGLNLSVFQEDVSSQDNDEFSNDTVIGHIVSRLGDVETEEGFLTNVYSMQRYVEEEAGPIKVPVFMGKTVDFIPQVVINALGVGPNITSSPLLGVSDIALSIYQKDADMSNSEYLTCNPMLVTSGVDNDEVPSVIGSAVAWNLPPSEAKAYYVEPKANCLDHMDSRIKALLDEAISYGAALLGSTGDGVKAAETVRMEQAASGATLKTTVEATGAGIELGLKMIARWMGLDEGLVSFKANIEFSEATLTPQEQTALLQSWLEKGISYDTYFNKFQEAGIIPGDRTIEEERALIQNSGPILDIDDDGDDPDTNPADEADDLDEDE